MNSPRIFVCYSVPLMKFLVSNGLKYEVVGLNPQSMKTFWAFIKDKELTKCLKEWKNNNPNK